MNEIPVSNQVVTPALEQPRTTLAPIFISIVLTALIVGGITFAYFNNQITTLKQEIQSLQSTKDMLQADLKTAANDKQEIEKKACKGMFIDGKCLNNSCVDSDINEKPDDIFIKGQVTYTDKNGVSTTVSDSCTGSKKQVNEKWCYESPEGSSQYVPGTLVNDCPNGCLDGACIKTATQSATPQ